MRRRRHIAVWVAVVWLAGQAFSGPRATPDAAASSTPPQISSRYGAPCPGQAPAYRVDGATPGVTYTITASIGTASPSQVTPTSGDFGFAVQLPVDVVPGQVVHIVVAPSPGSDLPAATLDEATRGPILRDLDSYNRPAGIGDPLPISTDCFVPGDPVTVSSPQLSFSAPTTTIGPDGTLSEPETITAITQTGTAIVTIHGQQSGSLATSFTVRNNVLRAGTSLQLGSFIVSSSGRFAFGLPLFGFGEIVTHQPNAVDAGADVVWPSNGAKTGGSVLAMQSDGNLVLYGGGRAIWASGTVGSRAGDRVVVQDDGSLVIYRGATAMWQTPTQYVPLVGYGCTVAALIFGLNPPSIDGSYVHTDTVAPGGYAGMLRASVSHDTPSGRSFYRICTQDGGSRAPLVYLQSMSNRRFISVELGYPGANYGMLRARATKVGSWEMFRSVPHNGWACLQSVANNRYVSAEFGYRGSTYAMLRARATAPARWETMARTS